MKTVNEVQKYIESNIMPYLRLDCMSNDSDSKVVSLDEIDVIKMSIHQKKIYSDISSLSDNDAACVETAMYAGRELYIAPNSEISLKIKSEKNISEIRKYLGITSNNNNYVDQICDKKSEMLKIYFEHFLTL